jgi:transcriptional regulator with XRE-family HTH domain
VLGEQHGIPTTSGASGERLRDVLHLLRAERARQGLSLADVQSRTGIARSALSRLETDPDANPTLTTIARYAEALGKDLQMLLADKARSA